MDKQIQDQMVVEVKQTIFKIPASNMGSFEYKFGKLVKASKKLHLKAPEYKVLKVIPASSLNDVYVPPQYEVEVTGEYPKIPGYAFLGTVEHTPNGNILRSFPGQTLSEDFRSAKSTCDHCNTKRNRTDTFVVFHEESKTVKRVGRACVKDFLGGMSPEMLAFYSQFLKDIANFDEDDDREGRSSGKRGIEILEFLAYCVMVVEEQGYYISKAKAQEQDKSTTASSAFMAYLAFQKNSKDATYPSPNQIDTAFKILDWVQHDMELNSSYTQNLEVMSHKIVLDNRDYGMVASMVPAYNYAIGTIKKQEKQLEEAKLNPSQYVMFPKKRIEMELILKKILTWTNEYGTTNCYIFHDSNQNVLVWKTSSVAYLPNYGGQCVEGRTYKIRASFKKYETYKGVQQTIIQRVDFLSENRIETDSLPIS